MLAAQQIVEDAERERQALLRSVEAQVSAGWDFGDIYCVAALL